MYGNVNDKALPPFERLDRSPAAKASPDSRSVMCHQLIGPVGCETPPKTTDSETSDSSQELIPLVAHHGRAENSVRRESR